MLKKSWRKIGPIDIQTLTQPPYLIFTDKIGSWISRKIKRHTHGQYSHCFWFLGGDVAVSQDWIYHKISMSQKYLKGKHRVKVWKLREGYTDSIINILIKQYLRRPFYKRLYDWLGVYGHWRNKPTINFADRMYCSESVGSILHRVSNFDIEGPTPKDVNAYCEEHDEEFICIGVYDPYETKK